MEDNSLKAKLARYMDAGFPIIYINTYEEDKIDGILSAIKADKEIYEWNETQGYIDAETRTPEFEDCSLETMLESRYESTVHIDQNEVIRAFTGSRSFEKFPPPLENGLQCRDQQ